MRERASALSVSSRRLLPSCGALETRLCAVLLGVLAFANFLARMDLSRLWANARLGIALTHRDPVFAVPIVPTSSSVPMPVAHDHQLLPIVIMVMALAGAYVLNTFAGPAPAYDDPVPSIPAMSAASAVAVPPTDHNDLPTIVVVVMAVAGADVWNGSGWFAPAYDDPELAVPMVPAARAVTVSAANHHDPRAIVVMIMAGS